MKQSEIVGKVLEVDLSLTKKEANKIASNFCKIIALKEREKGITVKCEADNLVLDWGTGGAKIALFSEWTEIQKDSEGKWQEVRIREENKFNNLVLKPLLIA